MDLPQQAGASRTGRCFPLSPILRRRVMFDRRPGLIRAPAPRTWILKLSGEQDVAAVPELEGHMECAFGSGAPVVIDLTTATFIDCQIVAWLARWSAQIASRGSGRLVVAIGTRGSAAQRLFDVLDLARSIPIESVATRADALDVVAAHRSSARPTDPGSA